MVCLFCPSGRCEPGWSIGAEQSRAEQGEEKQRRVELSVLRDPVRAELVNRGCSRRPGSNEQVMRRVGGEPQRTVGDLGAGCARTERTAA